MDVLAGRPHMSAAAIVLMATSSAEAPWAQVKCSFPILSPTVTTMRFQPIIVPRPSAIAIATLGRNELPRACRGDFW
jgi:hypothetical protein